MHLNDSNIIVEITIDYYVLYYGIVTVNNEFGLKIILKKLFLHKAKLVKLFSLKVSFYGIFRI